MTRGRKRHGRVRQSVITPEYNPVVAQEILDDMAEASDQDDFTLTPYEVGILLGMVDKWDNTVHELNKYMDRMSKVHRNRGR